MSQKKIEQMPQRVAALVGFTMLLLVALFQAMGFVLQRVRLAGQGEAAVVFPEWLINGIGLGLSIVCLALPFLFLRQTGKYWGYELHKGRSRVPVWVLLPIFMGAVVVANSITTLLQNLASFLLHLPVAETAALPKTGGGTLFYFMTVCVVSPVLEEVLFRGTVQQMLRVWGPRFSILVTSVLFCLLHTSLWQLPTVLVLSLLLGYTYEVSRSVRPCILLHFTNNAVVFLMQLIQEKMQPNAAFAMIFWLMILFVALFAASIWAVRHFKLGRKLTLRRDAKPLGTLKKRLRKIMGVPLFAIGVIGLVAHFVLGLVG